MPSYVARMMAVLAAAYPNMTIRRETIEVYVADLSDLPDDVLDAACSYCRANLKFFPTIAELREAAARLQSGAASLPPAGEAWGEFIRLGQCFSGDDPCPYAEMTSDIMRKTIRAMGWRYLCSSTNGMADRARFIELYDEYARRGISDYVMPPQLKSGEHYTQHLLDQLAGKLSAPPNARREHDQSQLVGSAK